MLDGVDISVLRIGVAYLVEHVERNVRHGMGHVYEEWLVFVGLDVIGDYITEINVTSPTCIRELDKEFGINISSILLDEVEKMLALS